MNDDTVWDKVKITELRFGIERYVRDPSIADNEDMIPSYRLRAWAPEENDAGVGFPIVHWQMCQFSSGEWTLALDGSLKTSGGCCDFANNHTEQSVAHTCGGAEGFLEFCRVLAMIPELVEQVQQKARAGA